MALEKPGGILVERGKGDRGEPEVSAVLCTLPGSQHLPGELDHGGKPRPTGGLSQTLGGIGNAVGDSAVGVS
jgi:hypothetical protein